MKFNQLSNEQKTILMFNQWIMYTRLPKSCDKKPLRDFYVQYENLRHWCVDLICELNGMYDSIPEVNDHNEALIYEKCEIKMNLKEFKNLKTYNFEVVVKNRKICPKIN